MPLFFILAEEVRTRIVVVKVPERLKIKMIQVNPCEDPSRACQEYGGINRTLCEETNQIADGRKRLEPINDTLCSGLWNPAVPLLHEYSSIAPKVCGIFN
jgi:hypothetical protein